jgi:hypothetical protein
MWWGIWSGTSLLAERFETLFVIECCVRVWPIYEADEAYVRVRC